MMPAHVESDPHPSNIAPLMALFIISGISTALAAFVSVKYSHTAISALESVLGIFLLFAIDGFLWIVSRRPYQTRKSSLRNNAILCGLLLGGLWMIEIGINNFLAPPVPLRDRIDNIFWVVIAFSILVLAIVRAFRSDSLLSGIEAGAWSGFTSGLVACCAALSLIVLGMRFILRDPLNLDEWTGRGTGAAFSSMAAYFAFETFAGAFLHIIVLGLAMGGLLGIIGGGIGKSSRLVSHRLRFSKVHPG
jgi:hypothetical protein